LSNALVGLDYDGDGVVDSSTVLTDADGNFSITPSQASYTVIAVTDESTIDASSGTVLSGITLKAPQGASVVTPTTTLMEEGNLTAAQVASVLGLPDGVDPLTFNPFADGVSASDALAVEKASQQIMSVVNAFASAAEGAGATEAAAYTAALNSIVEVVKTKAAASGSLDLTNTADLALIKTQAKTEMAATSGVNTTAFDALADDTATAIENVNTKIATVSDLTSDASKNIFSTTQVLADQVKTAAAAEVSSAGSGGSSITFTDSNVVNTAASNKAPTNIALNSSAISEAASSPVIGTLTTTDSDQTAGVKPTYALAKLAGSDHAAFTINQATGELSLKEQPDYETKASYSVTILSTDEGGKTFSKTFTIGVTDANDAPTGAVTISGTATQGQVLTAVSTLADADGLGSLSYQWKADSVAISGATSNTLTLGQSQVGKAITVAVSYTDGGGTVETKTSVATSSVADINDAPTGAVTISGTATQGQVLTAVSKLADADGLGTLSYQWKADSVAISGATSNTLTLGQSQVGKVITVAVSYTDGGGTVETKTSAATSLVTNINDAPILTVPKDGSVTEDASTPTISGSLVGADPDDDILTYVVPNAAAEDGSFSVAGTYGTLVLNASTGAYTYTLDNSAAAVQALGASSSETETFSVQVMDGSSTTAAQPLSFTIKGANDAPEAISLSSTVVGNNEIGPVVGELGSTDVDGLEVSYTLSGTDEAVFELDGSSLKFKDSVTVDTSIKATYNVIVTATDSEAGAISKSFEITVSDVDSRPFIREFKTSTKDGSYNQSSSDIVITAVMSENVSKNSTFNANLNNNVELTFNYVENSGNMLTATYAISEGDDIDDLAIISYDKGSVTDLSDLRMSSSSKEFVLGEIDIDTIAPTATVSQATAAKFTIGDDGSGTLVITGANFSSIAAVDSSVKSILDWSKVTWDVNGTGSGGGADLTFSSDNIASAVLTDTETITVKLTNETIATLQGRASFGGTTEGGEVSDTLDIAAGFLRDVAGNQASQAAISVTIVPTDVTPGAIDATELVPTNHTVSGEQTFLNISSQGVGDSLRLALDFDSDLLLDSSMLVTFNNGGTATLSRDESEASRLVGSYTVSSLDDDEAALAIQSITLNDTRDIYGNVISNADVIAALDEKLAQVTVDTTAPNVVALRYTETGDNAGLLEFIFNEKLSNEDTVGEHLISLSYTALKYESLVTEKTQIYKFNNLLEGSDFANAERTALDIGKLSLIDLAGNEFTYDDETSVFELIIL
jgi:VCBS repeat-containing protein